MCNTNVATAFVSDIDIKMHLCFKFIKFIKKEFDTDVRST